MSSTPIPTTNTDTDESSNQIYSNGKIFGFTRQRFVYISNFLTSNLKHEKWKLDKSNPLWSWTVLASKLIFAINI